MHYDVVFFDFDGTLVDSAPAKRQAFFELFPASEDYARVVRDTLDSDPDGSRYHVIPRMAGVMRDVGLAAPGARDTDGLIRRYGEFALDAVSRAPEIPGATRLLEGLRERDMTLYLCSNTPQDAIESLVQARGWGKVFDEIAGYPTRKSDFVRRNMMRNGTPPSRAAFVGDGISDQQAAEENGIEFLRVAYGAGLEMIADELLVNVHA